MVRDENSALGLTNDLSGMLAFHLSRKTVIGAVVAQITKHGSGKSFIALYDARGERVLLAALPANENGPTNALVEPPVIFQDGLYRLTWLSRASLATEVQALKIERGERDFLNAGGGEIILRSIHGLSAKLPEIELPGKQFPYPPRILFKG